MSIEGVICDEEETLLWQALLGGNESAFESMIQRCYDLMFQYGLKFSKERELVKDSIQDVFLEIWEKRQALNKNIPPKAYLLASLRRKLHRLQQRNKNVLVADPTRFYTEFQIEFSAEYRLIEQEEDRINASQITGMLNKLPARQQEAVYLRFFQDLDRYAIAEIMNIHPQSVSNLLQTAFKFLKSNWLYWIAIGFGLSALNF
ncbi:RNA polymerase sigma factor [Dyadobacter tibetensis]|uniref:RNA polymerase sigma factor n=1 Tax=Dyadobacter tibetensis TaxID=1211851 RepID=UPI0004719C9A|nr:sigma-70 family RNA polymerase sigma factor [Dyadobacter tibetensis]